MESPARQHYTLAEINQLPLLTYARVMTAVFFNASWVPVLAFPRRPFPSVEAFLEAMMLVLRGSDEESKLQVLLEQTDMINPPAPEDLAPEFQPFDFDRAFASRLSAEEKAPFEALQIKYFEKFGFPLVFCPEENVPPATLLASLEQRYDKTKEEEIATAIEASGALALARLRELIPN